VRHLNNLNHEEFEMTDGLPFITGELSVCETKMAHVNGLLAQIDPANKEVVDFLKRRRDHWIGYKGALLYVRDHRPGATVMDTVEI
jgi:hypothetical protein